MEETHEIKSLGGGKYSFLIGLRRYTLTTRLESARFKHIVEEARELVGEFPNDLSQDERLFLALMALLHKTEELRNRMEALSAKFDEEE